jgi:hypothetical protein
MTHIKLPNELGPSVPRELNWQAEAMRLSALLHSAMLGGARAEAKLAKAVAAMTALREDMLERSRTGMDAIHGEEYRIVNAGRTAWTDFCAVLAELEGK